MPNCWHPLKLAPNEDFCPLAGRQPGTGAEEHREVEPGWPRLGWTSPTYNYGPGYFTEVHKYVLTPPSVLTSELHYSLVLPSTTTLPTC